MTEYEWNPPERLPPVGCPLVIRLDDHVTMWVERTSHIADRAGQMEYRARNGMLLTGRYFWSYP